MSTGSIQGTPEKLDFEEIIERLSSLSGRLNEKMQSTGCSGDQDQLKQSCDQVEGLKKIAATVFQYFHKFEGDLQKSLNILESDVEEIINQLPRHPKRNPNLSHYVYHDVNENLMKAESSMRLLHEEVSNRKSRAVCARCEEDTRYQHEVSSAMSKQSDLSEEIRRKLVNISNEFQSTYCDILNHLLPFLVLPARAEVKRRMLSNLWTAQFWALSTSLCDIHINKFMEMGIIEPFKKRRGKEPKDASSFKMDPLIHAVVTNLAEEAKGNSPNESFSFGRGYNVCLVKGKELSYKSLDLMETLFNVNEQFPDLAVTAEQLSQMKQLRVLYLGSWETSTTLAEHDPIRHHIELEDIKFLRAIEHMKSLKFLSLRGISLISKLDVRKLTNLKSLDLKACWNLSELPDEFDSLKDLTNLDISGCYLLQRMPPSLAALSGLEVLKGFVISDQRNSCRLSNLPEWLSKLSIKIVMLGFDIERLSSELTRFKYLVNLKIEWGTRIEMEHRKRKRSQQSQGVNIEKLVLDGCPFKMLPNWVVPEYLKSLKKLYIRGGNLTNLGRDDRKRWEHLEILRLKYMEDLKMDWQEVGN